MKARASHWLPCIAGAVVGLVGTAIICRFTLGSWISLGDGMAVLAAAGIFTYILEATP